MKRRRDQERRHHPRYPFNRELRGQQLSLLGFPKERGGRIRGQIDNISPGGLCLLTDQMVRVSALVRCEILFSEVPVGISTLLQVRWTGKDSQRYRYRVGLQFLL